MLIKVVLHTKPGIYSRNMFLGNMHLIKATVRPRQIVAFYTKNINIQNL